MKKRAKVKIYPMAGLFTSHGFQVIEGDVNVETSQHGFSLAFKNPVTSITAERDKDGNLVLRFEEK